MRRRLSAWCILHRGDVLRQRFKNRIDYGQEGARARRRRKREDAVQRQGHGLRGLLLIMVLWLVFMLGVAIGQAHADTPQDPVAVTEAPLEQEAPPRFQTEVIAERDCLELQVRPRHMLPLSRGDIRIELRIARHAHHRQFSVAWDGGFAGAGGSAQSLHGEVEPFLHVREVKNQPAAPWHVVAAVFDTNGKLLRRRTADILMPEGATP